MTSILMRLNDRLLRALITNDRVNAETGLPSDLFFAAALALVELFGWPVNAIVPDCISATESRVHISF